MKQMLPYLRFWKENHKTRLILFLLYNFLYFILNLLRWPGRIAIARERKRNGRGKRGRRSREAGAGPLMFESHRPPGCVFAFPWKCTLSKGYSESWGDEWTSGRRKRSIGAERSGGDRCQSFAVAVATWRASVTATNSVNRRQMRVHFEASKMRRTDGIAAVTTEENVMTRFFFFFFFLSFPLFFSLTFFLLLPPLSRLTTVKLTATVKRHCLDAPKLTVKALLSSRSQTRHGRLRSCDWSLSEYRHDGQTWQ